MTHDRTPTDRLLTLPERQDVPRSRAEKARDIGLAYGINRSGWRKLKDDPDVQANLAATDFSDIERRVVAQMTPEERDEAQFNHEQAVQAHLKRRD